MKSYIKHHPWQIIEDQYDIENNKISESLFSIGNGKMGQRACFEEFYTGETMSGNYIGGVYYPDKTKVGWWKNGYPEYFAKVLNSVNWIKLDIYCNGERLDINKLKVTNFSRVLDMKEGVLYRNCDIQLTNGMSLRIESQRFCSMDNSMLGALSYSIKSIDFEGSISIRSYIDFDVQNEDSNYDEKFWIPQYATAEGNLLFVQSKTRKTEFVAAASAGHKCTHNDSDVIATEIDQEAADTLSILYQANLVKSDTITLEKYCGITSSLDYDQDDQLATCSKVSSESLALGFDKVKENQIAAWDKKWQLADIVIEGDESAQQGIRFNIFQLLQTYTGEDNRLNIGPKGFTGEKYGGSTYWDTEAYCLPFYLGTTGQNVARNLLVYRYNHLQKAIENASLLGFKDGAALYPMVTMNGEECHNEWEITFEEIHRNGAISYAIYDYINYTNDQQYLAQYGLEVLVAIARFWEQRVNYSKHKEQYVILGVTGPNEYENNVNNNWYTNYIAVWCMRYAKEAINIVKTQFPRDYDRISSKINITDEQLSNWSKICNNMYFPEDKSLGVKLQQDGFLDKELTPVSQVNQEHLPLNQKWSWDRILRSCYIKQADVLQGIYFFENNFNNEEIEKNFTFYEPLTVHESSLSPCVHSILASKIGHNDKAYEMYLRTARLDLDNYNNDTEDGCHITSMAGTWLSVIKGFAGFRVRDHKIILNPNIPQQWQSIEFKIRFRKSLIAIKLTGSTIELQLTEGGQQEISINNIDHSLADKLSISV